LAGSLAIFGVALAPTAGATTSVTTSRLAGTTRYGTAQAVATDPSLATGAGTVAIVASGEDAHLADALAASGLAGVSAPAPIVLTQTDTYTTEAKNALATLKGKGVKTVKVVGGTAAVSDTVFNAITADGFTTTRVADVDRFATAAAVATAAKAIKAVGTTGGLATAIIANGFTYVDALASGAMSYSQNFPVLLVNADSVPSSTSSAISSLGIKKVIIAGGTAAVSSAVQSTLESATGNPALRLAGVNRNDTAAQIGTYEISTLGYPATTAVLANGLTLVDALADGPYAGQNKAPIVLTASLPTESAAFLDKYSNTIAKIVASGGTAAISDADLTAAQTSAQTTANDTSGSAAPELQSVNFISLNTGSSTISVGFNFDEPVTLVAPTNFKAWTAYGESQSSTVATLSSTNSSQVVVQFSVAVPDPAIAEATTFTVVAGAVQDAGGRQNPEGKAPGLIAQSFAANQTRNPDLTAVALVTTTPANTTYDFTFDAGTTGFTVVNPNGFSVVDTNGNVRASASATINTASSTSTATVVRAVFAAPAGVETAVRGVANSGAVSDVFTRSNPTEAAAIGTNASDSPDLVSVSIDTTANTVSYTFDENVETLGTQGVRTGYFIFDRQGQLGGVSNAIQSLSADRSTTDLRTVVATFPSGAVNEFVGGAYVADSTVARLGSTLATKPNRVDEKGVASSFALSAYLGPQLTLVTTATTTDSFGTATGATATFTFDQGISLTDGTKFFAVAADGTRRVLPSCAASFTTQVKCTAAGGTSLDTAAIQNAKVFTVASGAVTGTKTRLKGATAITIVNHEEARLT